MVPQLNEMYEKYAEQGLVIVGVTNESSKLVDGSIASSGQTFPIAMVKGGSVDTAYGVDGFPTVVLVGPDGLVLSKKRHPEAEIIEALKRAVLFTPLEGKQYSALNKMLKKKQFGKAWKSIVSMLDRGVEDEQLSVAKETIERGFAGRFERAEALMEEGDWGNAIESFGKMADLYAGYDRASEAKSMVKVIKKNPEAKDELAAHSMLRKAKAEFAKGKKGNTEKGEKICRKIIAKYPRTVSATKAKTLRGARR